MELTALAFYAVVCGLLSLVSPVMTSALSRLIVGGGIGVAAAATLPLLQNLIAY